MIEFFVSKNLSDLINISIFKVDFSPQVSGWSRQRGTRLRDGLANFRRTNSLLEELIAWLNGAETKLFNDNAEPIPDDTEIIVALIQDHQVDIIARGTVQSLYNTPHYNTDLDITWSCCGSQIFYQEFYKGIIGK